MRDEPEIRACEDDGFLLVWFSFFGKAGDGVQGKGAAFEPPFPAQHCRNHPAVSCKPHAEPLPRPFANKASFAFCIRRAASVSLICLAWRWSNSALTPSFKYCCQSANEVSFSKGV